MNQSQQILHCLSVAAPFRPVPHMSWHFQGNIIVSLEFRSSLEVHLPICSTGGSQCFVEPLGSLAGLARTAANRTDSYSPSGLSGLCSTWDWWSLNQGQGCCPPLTNYRPSTKSWGHHWGCFQSATAIIGCVTVFRVVSPQAESSHIQHPPRTTFVLSYSHVETASKSLCSWSILLVFAFHLY